MAESAEDRRLGQLVLESIRRSEGRPRMTDAEFDALLVQELDALELADDVRASESGDTKSSDPHPKENDRG